MRIISLILLLFPLQSFSAQAIAASAEASTSELKVSLISECKVAPQQGEFSVGFYFELQPDWHLYWINPGDAGLAPTVKWQLPNGISAGDIAWPYPHAIHTEAISNFGYSDTLLLATKLTTKNPANTADISANISWLVCKDECIPGKASLTKSIALGESCEANEFSEKFKQTQQELPKPLALLDGEVRIIDKKFQLELYAAQPVFRNAKQVDLFIENTRVVSYQRTQEQRWKHNWMIWTQNLNESYQVLPEVLNAVIVVDHKTAYSIQLPLEDKTP